MISQRLSSDSQVALGFSNTWRKKKESIKEEEEEGRGIIIIILPVLFIIM